MPLLFIGCVVAVLGREGQLKSCLFKSAAPQLSAFAFAEPLVWKERLNSLPSSGDRVKALLTSWKSDRSLLRGTSSLEELEGVQPYVACWEWVGVLCLWHSWKWQSFFWKVMGQVFSSLHHLSPDTAAESSRGTAAMCTGWSWALPCCLGSDIVYRWGGDGLKMLSAAKRHCLCQNAHQGGEVCWTWILSPARPPLALRFLWPPGSWPASQFLFKTNNFWNKD